MVAHRCDRILTFPFKSLVDFMLHLMYLKHKFLVMQEFLILWVDIKMFKKLLDHERFSTAGIPPEVDTIDIIQDLVILLQFLK
jgi:hypothetical protein